jgi:exopolyphosphatase/guanosine-5'-triphosphate,3'-diphosphate pyrophosphatase
MEPVRRAVIDVGTNSIKLLVADVAVLEVRPLLEESQQTRLGQGFYETHRLQPEAIASTARAVGEFALKAKHLQARSIRIIATSAARDATNPDALISAIEQASGLKVEIISGEQEADWAFRGVTTMPGLAHQPLLLLDVGGGSTEFILGQGDHKHFSESFPLGTVRLLEGFPHRDPPEAVELAAVRGWLQEFLRLHIRPKLEPALAKHAGSSGAPIQLVGTGGTTSILARIEAQLETFDRAIIDGTRLSLERVRHHAQLLWSLPLEKRKQVVGLPQNRADVILPGVLIYEQVMEQFGFETLNVSTRGLRFAVVMEGP